MTILQGAVLERRFSLAEGKTLTQTFWITTFAILTGLAAQLQIPHQPVPYTFQALVVLLAGATLGPRNGFLSMVMYLSIGAIGLPVFSGAGFGFARIFGPTGGYLIGFPLAAFVIGSLLSHRQGYYWTLFSMFLGLLVIFTLGTIQLNLVYFQNWGDAFKAGFLIFSWWDILKLVAATTIAHQLAGRIRR